MSHPTSTVHHRFQQIGLLLGLLLIVPLIAFTIVQLNGPDLRKQAFDNLNSIVALKVGQIEHWLDERRMDLEFLVAGEGFVSRAEDLILTSNADSRAFVVRRLETYLKSRYYHSAILVNAAGEGVVAIGEHDKITPVMRELLQDALKSGQVTRSDLYRDEASGHIHIEYLVPLPGTGGRLPVAAVVLHALPERFLFPLIQTWPVASASAESLLVRRDGKDVLFLNELRHRQGAAMSLRLPLDRANSLASVAAVLSHSPQTLESLDYRGVAVLAATHPVAGTPWHLVAKIDREEVMVPIKTLIGWVSLVTLAAIITIAWVIEQLRRQMLHSHRLELSAQAQADLQRSEQKFRILSENATDSIFWTAPDGHFLYVSPACKTIFGYEPESFMGYPSLMETLIHPECLDSYRSHMQNLQEKEDTSLEFCFVHRDGHIRWFAHQCRAIYDEKDHFLGRRGSNTDITEKKRLREELDRHRHHLEERVVQRTEELIAARQEAESANRAKSEFLANMSHEIRTPMNAIIGLADLAIKLEMPAKLRDYLAKIAHAAQSLLRIINDILDFSKIEAGKLELELSAFLLREVFDRLGDLFRAQATEKKLELILCLSEECRYELRGDSLRLEQILMNLVSNALKFTEEGEIEVQAKTLQESAHQVTLEFSVRDTGIGMVDGTADQIFLPFTQADTSVTRQFGGTGLGLSISKRLVEMMGGSIWAHSELGRGSVFRFTASFQRNLGVETRDMIPPENMERLKALVVDDNRPARNALRKMLEMFGFSVTGAGSGPEAIEA
ncbi:MAG: ATP-binding protein, partial [Pseudomonadota bacterium]